MLYVDLIRTGHYLEITVPGDGVESATRPDNAKDKRIYTGHTTLEGSYWLSFLLCVATPLAQRNRPW
jgi:hypothetical protein